MAKQFVRISLATKFRLLFGTAVLVIIAAALVVPWYFMELLAQQNLQVPAEELTRLRLQEWLRDHPNEETRGRPSTVAQLYAQRLPEEVPRGMALQVLTPEALEKSPLDAEAARARRAFQTNKSLDVTILRTQEEDGDEELYRCFRAVRMDATCLHCHGRSPMPVERQFPQGQLVAMVDVTLPPGADSGPLVVWTRVAFLLGGGLAAALAFVLFVILSHRLVLRPLRHLGKLADRVAEGDLSVRSRIRSGDELQRLGESFNEMLDAIAAQTERLRSANRALDLKLNELAHANVALFQANQVKSDFLTNVSHELRTPLNSIIGFADLIREQPDARIRRWGENVSVAAKNLLNMINDLLDLAKIEARKTEIRYDKVAITDTCQTLLDLVRPLADKKQIELVGRIDPHLPLITTDGGKVQQILYNLLSNAVKFTPPKGKVTLAARLEDVGREGRRVSVTVNDTGPGIAEADQARIFEKFYQGDKPLTKEAGGTGLGLAISRELAHLLGGRLTVRSEPGQGATFALVLPLEPPQAPREPEAGETDEEPGAAPSSSAEPEASDDRETEASEPAADGPPPGPQRAG